MQLEHQIAGIVFAAIGPAKRHTAPGQLREAALKMCVDALRPTGTLAGWHGFAFRDQSPAFGFAPVGGIIHFRNSTRKVTEVLNKIEKFFCCMLC
jgi:hypothetical protein